MKENKSGFTIVELMTSIVIIGILAGLAVVYISSAREKAYKARADSELLNISNATKLYATRYNKYPPDVNRDIPADIKTFIAVDNDIDGWPSAPWPNSVYDYDKWDIDGDGNKETIQISIRFCPLDGSLSDCTFPDQPWASNFRTKSAYYYCIKGYCRSHEARSYSYAGYCVNCPGNKAVKLPTE